MTVPADAPVLDPAVVARHRAMPLTRLVDCGMDAADARALHARSAAGEGWADAGTVLAAARLDKAHRALAARHPLTAVIQARWAAGAALFAQMADNQDTERKRALYRRYTETVSFVADLDGMRRVTVPYAGGQLAGWLRRPAGRPSAGTVIVWGGLSGWGAAYLRTADAVTARGLSCLLVEGPGQGESRLDHGLYMDGQTPNGFARFVDAVTSDVALRVDGVGGPGLLVRLLRRLAGLAPPPLPGALAGPVRRPAGVRGSAGRRVRRQRRPARPGSTGVP